MCTKGRREWQDLSFQELYFFSSIWRKNLFASLCVSRSPGAAFGGKVSSYGLLVDVVNLSGKRTQIVPGTEIVLCADSSLLPQPTSPDPVDPLCLGTGVSKGYSACNQLLAHEETHLAYSFASFTRAPSFLPSAWLALLAASVYEASRRRTNLA